MNTDSMSQQTEQPADATGTDSDIISRAVTAMFGDEPEPQVLNTS
jgi:hypothetical protein